jgi:hypothetical protein
MDEYRRLQKTCESQVALTSSPKARTALREMAEEYRKRADHNEIRQRRPDADMAHQGETH